MSESITDKIGLGVVTYNRPRALDALIGWAWAQSSYVGRIMVVVHTGAQYLPGPIEKAAAADGFEVMHLQRPNVLPAARGAAEEFLVACGYKRFVITDDDVLLDFSRYSVDPDSWSSDRDIVGGGLRQLWKQPLDDDAYMAWLKSNNPVPGGRVVPVTAIYSKPMVGLWRRVAELGIDFVGEDQAWCYLAHLRGANFINRGFVGLHAPPKKPKPYPTFPAVWDAFMKRVKELQKHYGGLV